MGQRTEHGLVLVDGEPALVVDATAAALRSRGLDARLRRGEIGAEQDSTARVLVLLVPAGAEAVFRAVETAGRTGLLWGAIVDGRGDPRGTATKDALLEAGASWALDADTGLAAVVSALDRLAAIAIDPDLTARPVSEAGPEPTPDLTPAPTPAARLATLTAQERAVLDAMADGRALAETAEHLGLTVPTVRAHRRAIRAKLGVRTQLAAVALLLRQEAEDDRPERRPVRGPTSWRHPEAPVPNLA